MTEEALKIRDYIANSDLSERAKNEILPLLGVIDAPGVKERILKILEIEGKVLDVEEKFLNLDIDNPNGAFAPVPPVISSPVPEPASATPVTNPVTPVAPQPSVTATPIPTPQPTPIQQPTVEDQNIAQLQQQLHQLQPSPQ